MHEISLSSFYSDILTVNSFEWHKIGMIGMAYGFDALQYGDEEKKGWALQEDICKAL